MLQRCQLFINSFAAAVVVGVDVLLTLCPKDVILLTRLRHLLLFLNIGNLQRCQLLNNSFTAVAVVVVVVDVLLTLCPKDVILLTRLRHLLLFINIG